MLQNIYDVKPNVVSKDIRSYSFLVYGGPKIGKTTFAASMPKSLILAFEIGYKAIPGAIALPLNSWAEFLQVLNQLKTGKKREELAASKGEEVEPVYETIIIDIVDIAWDLCEKYILAQQGVEKIADVPYGGGYTLVANEFDSKMRSIIQMGYGVVFISHSQSISSEDVKDVKYATCTLSKRPKAIITRMVDIYGYATIDQTADGLVHTLHMRATPEWEAGSRFRFAPESVPFDYKSVVAAIDAAIDKDNEVHGGALATQNYVSYDSPSTARSFEEIKESINNLIGSLVADSPSNSSKISAIVEERLGRDHKLSTSTPENLEQLIMIEYDLKQL